MTRRTGRWPFPATAPLLLVLGGCSQTPTVRNIAVGGMPVGPAQGSSNGPVATDIRIAVAHRFILVAPGPEIEALQQKHMAECKRLDLQHRE